MRGTEDNLLLLDYGGVLADPGKDLKVKADVSLKAMSFMGYDAMNLGNSEFYLGADYLKSASSVISFPFISTNITGGKTRLPWVKDHIIKKMGDYKLIKPKKGKK